MKNQDILQKFYKEGRPAMFVANHCSWMDIPFLGATIGWRNYKLISKKELGVVPILGTAIRTGGNIMVDRSDRRSQLATLKQGIEYLKKVSENIVSCVSCEKHDKMKRKSQHRAMSHNSRVEFIFVRFQKEPDLVPDAF
jgi:1-acyl-sn-glycerol-3-phosphate acyltransferase